MRSLLVLIDGLGDSPIPAWQGQTPFEHAVHPAMDALPGHLGASAYVKMTSFPKAAAVFCGFWV